MLSAAIGAAAPQQSSPFDEPDRIVRPSPVSVAELILPAGARVVDFDSSPAGGQIAAILAPRAGGPGRIVLWTPGQPPVEAWNASAGMSLKSVTWHPAENQLFVLATAGSESQILRLTPGTQAWTAAVVYRSNKPMRRLLVGPRPFVVGNEPGPDGTWKRSYRLFFAAEVSTGQWATYATTAEGRLTYEVIGPKEGMTALNKSPDGPAAMVAESALPLSFHPAGHILLWEDGRKNFHCATYGEKDWQGSKPLWAGALTGGSVTALPNGLGVLHWTAGSPGVRAVTRGGKDSRVLAQEWTFLSTPSIMPDGKGIIGLTRAGKDTPDILRYVPVTMPLGDVQNAWMFAEGIDDAALLERNGGLFRRFGGEQLYQLYDSELYSCGGYAETVATRPYLVTTDALWEVWAAAFEGLFILREREEAIPAFWAFVGAAAADLEKTSPGSRQARLFNAALASRDKATHDQEALRIRTHKGTATSTALGEPFDFGELVPRGHYTTSEATRDYFSAMRYLTSAETKAGDVATLVNLSDATKEKAVRWIDSYRPFIAPARSAEVFRSGATPRKWVLHPGTDPVLFPLSWGFDNETLDSTVFHSTWPEADQVKGTSGPRLVPSGLDVAAAFGSEVARKLLAKEIETYPPLGRALDRLAARRPAREEGASLYERWLEALGTQWADEPLSTAHEGTRQVWGVKRLQTGLASWATLRHATVLVNDRSMAECGEGGFEELIRRPPRGWVETDPKTFEAIASLFEETARFVENSPTGLRGNLPSDSSENAATESLRQGLLKRLRDTAVKARNFGRMAGQELKGQPLSSADYEAILYFGRAAEHDLLVYKSLAGKDLALSTPDPMPKVADVAGGGEIPLLLAAVGAPLEFDLVVPSGGTRQVVKGSVYAYQELTAREPMTDEEWRKREPSTPLAPWVVPFTAKRTLTCPAQDPF